MAGETPPAGKTSPWLEHGRKPWTVRVSAESTPSRIWAGWSVERSGGFDTLAEALDLVADTHAHFAREALGPGGGTTFAPSSGFVELWRYDGKKLSVPLWRHALSAEEAVVRLESICKAVEELFGHMDRKDVFLRTKGTSAFDPPRPPMADTAPEG